MDQARWVALSGALWRHYEVKDFIVLSSQAPPLILENMGREYWPIGNKSKKKAPGGTLSNTPEWHFAFI